MNTSNYFINNPSLNFEENVTIKILRKGNAFAFHKTLESYKPTPVALLPILAKKYDIENIFIKDESHRFGLNAFKGLGASYAIYELLKNNPFIQTFCTATDGNHGKAVAWSAALYKKNAVIFMPANTVTCRIKAIESFGAKVIVTNYNYDATCALAAELALANNWQLVQDTSWEHYEEIPAYIMVGYLTHFVELENSLHTLPHPQIDFVFLQAGVGSWAAAAVWYYANRYQKNKPQIVIVEPAASDGILESFKNDSRSVPIGNQKTVMAGLNCGIPSLSAWNILKNGVDFSMRITDDDVKYAIKILYNPYDSDEPIVAGESGAAGLAGFITLMKNPKFEYLKTVMNIKPSSKILCFNTEGATDPINFNLIINSIK